MLEGQNVQPPPCPPEEEQPMPRVRVSPPVQPETSFEVGEDEAWKTNLKILTDLGLTPNLTNLQNIIGNFQSLSAQSQKLEAKLDSEVVQAVVQARRHSEELQSQRLVHYANVNAASLTGLNSLVAQIQRQGDVGATALFYNIPAKSIDASIADDFKNLVEAAMKQQSDAITKTVQDMQASLVALYQLLGLKSTPAGEGAAAAKTG